MEALAEDASIFKRAKNLLKDSKSSPDNSEEKLLKREDSYKLLWEELEELKEPTSTTRESLYKTLQGVAVLRARLVLATLLSNWPQEGRRLSTTFLGCSDIIHYFCLLDLLLQQQTLEEKEKVREGGREGEEGEEREGGGGREEERRGREKRERREEKRRGKGGRKGGVELLGREGRLIERKYGDRWWW